MFSYSLLSKKKAMVHFKPKQKHVFALFHLLLKKTCTMILVDFLCYSVMSIACYLCLFCLDNLSGENIVTEFSVAFSEFFDGGMSSGADVFREVFT